MALPQYYMPPTYQPAIRPTYQENLNTQPMPMQTVMPPMIKGRPVSSLEEVRAAAIDFDGSVFYFPDLANKRIYTKQINMDGTASLNMYELQNLPIETPQQNPAYITREEFENTLRTLNEQYKQLFKQLEEKKSSALVIEDVRTNKPQPQQEEAPVFQF